MWKKGTKRKGCDCDQVFFFFPYQGVISSIYLFGIIVHQFVSIMFINYQILFAEISCLWMVSHEISSDFLNSRKIITHKSITWELKSAENSS
jgi:hypothetical protein